MGQREIMALFRRNEGRPMTSGEIKEEIKTSSGRVTAGLLDLFEWGFLDRRTNPINYQEYYYWINSRGENMYRMLKSILKGAGWKEQKQGEVYINGEFMTNFGKDGEVIHLSFDLDLDEEEYDNMFD